MKTIMIVPELPCKNCHKYKPNACVECFNKNGKKEQVPETFEELKELCKSIKGNKKDCGGAMWFEFGCLNNDKMYLGKFLCIDEKGQVGIAERSWGGDISITIFAQNRTPQQMWQIIKSLIGEE